MKRLLLLRHAKAEPAEEPLADIARPLMERGERDARYIAKRLHENHCHPDLIIASPAARTVRTAELVADAVGYARAAIAFEPRLYLAEPTTLIDVVAARNAAAPCILVVGHNPGITDLAHELLPNFDVDDLPTAAVVGVDYAELGDWAELGKGIGRGRLAYYDFPKNPRPPLTAG